MYNGEWSLIIFTILIQCAVGIWMYGIVVKRLLGEDWLKFATLKAPWRPLLVVGPLMCVALVVSIFHLGTPMQAYASIANLFSSWLSREIVFSCLFLFFWVISIIRLRRAASGDLLSWIALLLGIAAIFSMGSIYYTTPLPAWTTMYTYIGFYATMLVLGAVSYVFILCTAKGFNGSDKIRQTFWKLSLLTLGVILIQLASFGYHFYNFKVDVLVIPAILYGLCLLLGGVGFVISTYQSKKNPTGKSSQGILSLSFFLLWVGAFIGRYLFYAIAISLLG